MLPIPPSIPAAAPVCSGTEFLDERQIDNQKTRNSHRSQYQQRQRNIGRRDEPNTDRGGHQDAAKYQVRACAQFQRPFPVPPRPARKLLPADSRHPARRTPTSTTYSRSKAEAPFGFEIERNPVGKKIADAIHDHSGSGKQPKIALSSDGCEHRWHLADRNSVSTKGARSRRCKCPPEQDPKKSRSACDKECRPPSESQRQNRHDNGSDHRAQRGPAVKNPIRQDPVFRLQQRLRGLQCAGPIEGFAHSKHETARPHLANGPATPVSMPAQDQSPTAAEKTIRGPIRITIQPPKNCTAA